MVNKVAWYLLVWSLPVFAFALDKTPTGIPLDTSWKIQIFEFAQKNVVHPSWGLAHSERNYQLSKSLAQKEKINLDDDVLFAAAFLHDVGGLAAFEKEGVDHAVRSVEVAEPLLTKWGFPMEKFPQVKEMILGHVYYGQAPATKAAQSFRDADILDFLGSLGAARILAITQEGGGVTLKPMIDVLKTFVSSLPEKCSLAASKDLALLRKASLQRFIDEVEEQSLGGTAL